MSALPPEADMLIVGINVCYVPTSDMAQRYPRRDASWSSSHRAGMWLSLGVACGHHNNPSDTARNTASLRALTASFKKIRLTWDFTVSGEISRARAMCLLERPWPIIARISLSRAVSVLPTRLLSCAE